MSLHLILDHNRATYEPGETVTGTLSWQLPEPPRMLEVQLSWTTRGKGTVDSEIVGAQTFESLPAAGERPFSVNLPDTPYTFSGKLISVLWQIRLLARPSKDEITLPIVVSPTGREIDLTRLAKA
jgi:hypothetical protein